MLNKACFFFAALACLMGVASSQERVDSAWEGPEPIDPPDAPTCSPTARSSAACTKGSFCPIGIPVGYYPDLSNKNAYCYCTGTAAPSRYERCNAGLVWDNFGTPWLGGKDSSGAAYGKAGSWYPGYWGTIGGGCGWAHSLHRKNRQRPPYTPAPNFQRDACGAFIMPSESPSSIPSFLPSMVPSIAPSIAPSEIPSVIPSQDPSSLPSFTPSIGPKYFTFTFPATTTREFVHGICIMGASQHEVSAETTDRDLWYEAQSTPWGNGSKLWMDRAYVAKGISTAEGDTSQCQGGTYLEPSRHKSVDRGTIITAKVLYYESYDITLCAYVNIDRPGRNHQPRHGGWNNALPSDGFVRSANFRFSGYHGRNFIEEPMVYYCKPFSSVSSSTSLTTLVEIDIASDVPSNAPIGVPSSVPSEDFSNGPSDIPTHSPSKEPTDPPSSATPLTTSPKGCCSSNFKTCNAPWKKSKSACNGYGLIWLEEGAVGGNCKIRYKQCRNHGQCCPGLRCKGSRWWKSCNLVA